MNPEVSRHLRHNLIVNLLDGGFFGFAIGFASFVTIIPLFVSTMTDSALLIGLIPAIHGVGWQLPQVFIANRVSRQPRYLPMVVLITTQERLPFLGLALVAWFRPQLGVQTALALTFLLLIWQGLGGGFTAAPWQSLIGKIIPGDRRGSFYGLQSASASLLGSISAILAGVILSRLSEPLDFTVLFVLAGLILMISLFFLSITREPHTPPEVEPLSRSQYWQSLAVILRQDRNFRWFLLVRMLSQIAIIGSAFYTVYAVRSLGMSEVQVGVMTGVLLATQIVANPLMGWLGDRWGHRRLIQLGILSAGLGALIAWMAASPAWFYLVFILTGVGNVAVWTLPLALTLQFGTEAQRPAYIGLTNSLTAPMTILAPLLGGWLADLRGYGSAFTISVAGAVITTFVLQFFLSDPLPNHAIALAVEEPGP